MKKSLLFAGAIFLTSGIAIAKTIDFDTSIKWNSNVVERALNKSGFLGASDANWDVRVTHERILAELLKMESFSLRDATRVCLDKCNMSDFLKNGRGASGKKCPELCRVFAEQLINENNGYNNLDILNPDQQDTSFRNIQGRPDDICLQLSQKAREQGLTLPMLCGGTCKRFGDDKIIVTDNIKTIEFIVGDFCDGDGLIEEKEYYMIVSSNGVQDVTWYTEHGRLAELKKTQSKPAYDYIERQKESTYANLVQQNGYCKSENVAYYETQYSGEEIDGNKINKICTRAARKFAQKHACKLKKWSSILHYSGGFVVCFINTDYNKEQTWDGKPKTALDRMVYDYAVTGYEGISVNTPAYDYTPTYKECVATFNEQICNKI